MNVRSAIETYRYWNRQTSICAEQASSIDVAPTMAELRRMRCDADYLIGGLMHQGIAVVDGYWPAEKCAAARAEIDRLLAAYPQAVHHSSGGSDKRMFGVESVSKLLAEFHDDPFLSGVGEMNSGLKLYNFATLGARIDATPENSGSGDGWHRDAHGSQFKSILYLSDVAEENGPFEYLPGSHKSWRVVLDTALGDLPAAPNTRYEPAAIDRLSGRFHVKRCQYAAKAGSLLLVNTAGIHRGMPLMAGSRYALTNYLYHPFQIDLDRVRKFPTLIPGTADRIIADLRLA